MCFRAWEPLILIGVQHRRAELMSALVVGVNHRTHRMLEGYEIAKLVWFSLVMKTS